MLNAYLHLCEHKTQIQSMFPFLEKEAKVVLMQIFSLLFPIHSLSCWQGEFV